MKKFFAILFCLTLVFSLAACGSQNTAPESENATQGGATGLASPVTELGSMEELCEKGDFALVKPTGIDITEEHFRLIEGEPQVAEYTFTAEGLEFFVRFAKADASTDICGIYKDGKTLFDGNDDTTCYIQNDDIKIKRWFTVDGQYIFGTEDKNQLEWEKYDALDRQFADIEPVNWNGSAPYAEYKALTGNYDNGTANVCVMNIRYDHMGVYTMVTQDDGSRLYWEIDAELKDGKLVYDSAKLTQYVYDEEKGETVTTEPGEEKGGTITVKDGKVDFSACGSEQLQPLVFSLREG